jgi:hypothetical protein
MSVEDIINDRRRAKAARLAKRIAAIEGAKEYILAKHADLTRHDWEIAARRLGESGISEITIPMVIEELRKIR